MGLKIRFLSLCKTGRNIWFRSTFSRRFIPKKVAADENHISQAKYIDLDKPLTW